MSGFGFVMYGVATGNGMVEVSKSEAERYEKDPIGWCAQFHKTTRERFESWVLFENEDRRCRAITRKRSRCKVILGNWPDAGSFVPGIDDLCPIHSEHGTPAGTV